MKAELKTKWVEALRSGRYQQGRNGLRSELGERHCCLGVLADVMGCDWSDPYDSLVSTPLKDRGWLPYALREESGLTEEQMHTFGHANDDGYTFNHIAVLIEKEMK